MEKVLWAVKNGDEDWNQVVITSTTDPAHLVKARKWAEENGYGQFRIQILDGKKPDFVGTIRV